MRQTETLIWAVVALAAVAGVSITILTIWRPGDNTPAITAILSVVAPAVSVLILLLQGQQMAKRVDATAAKIEETKLGTDMAAGRVIQVAKSIEEARQHTIEKVDKLRQDTSNKVEEIREMVNGQTMTLQRRIAELELALKQVTEKKQGE